MTDILQSRIVPSAEATDSAVGEETVILHLKAGMYYGLDPVGTRVWSLLKEGLDPTSICAQLASEYDASPEVIKGDVRRLLSELKSNSIVEVVERTSG